MAGSKAKQCICTSHTDKDPVMRIDIGKTLGPESLTKWDVCSQPRGIYIQ